MINSPANPTGVVLSRNDWQGVVDSLGSGTWIISDEIYHGLVYEGECPSALQFTDRAFVIGGFSKLYAMTGWRLGYCIVPQPFVRLIQKLQQNLYICAPSVAQAAALEALTSARAEVERAVSDMVRQYRRRRDLLLEGLDRIGLKAGYRPAGAYYVLVDTSSIDGDSHRLATDILKRVGVALTPGIDFGRRGEGHLRISYAASLNSLEEGLRRLEHYLQAR
jgi:aspartate/methionine/tyrosine aminotransferase